MTETAAERLTEKILDEVNLHYAKEGRMIMASLAALAAAAAVTTALAIENGMPHAERFFLDQLRARRTLTKRLSREVTAQRISAVKATR